MRAAANAINSWMMVGVVVRVGEERRWEKRKDWINWVVGRLRKVLPKMLLDPPVAFTLCKIPLLSIQNLRTRTVNKMQRIITQPVIMRFKHQILRTIFW
jgi:hypothetical protein